MAVSPFAENQRVTEETVKPSRKISNSTKSGIRPLLQERIIDLISRTGAFDPAYQLSYACDSSRVIIFSKETINTAKYSSLSPARLVTPSLDVW